jgi:hypothetical protein
VLDGKLFGGLKVRLGGDKVCLTRSTSSGCSFTTSKVERTLWYAGGMKVIAIDSCLGFGTKLGGIVKGGLFLLIGGWIWTRAGCGVWEGKGFIK